MHFFVCDYHLTSTFSKVKQVQDSLSFVSRPYLAVDNDTSMAYFEEDTY